IEGQVTEVEQGKTLPEIRGKGKLNFKFDDVVFPNGSRAPLMMTLVSVNDTKGNKNASTSTSNEGEVSRRTSGGTVAKDVGIGAGIGTVAGLIFGHAIRGLAIGAIAGGGYVLATQGKDANLPAQSGLVLRTDAAIQVPASTSTGSTTPR